MKCYSLLFTVFACLFLPGACKSDSPLIQQRWSGIPTRSWVGAAFWANRLQDWQVQGGRLFCLATDPRLTYRTVHLMTHRLEKLDKEATISLWLHTASINPDREALAGILLGAGPDLDVLGASLTHQATGVGAGILVGVRGDRSLVIRDMERDSILAETPENPRQPWQKETLQISLKPDGGLYRISVKGNMQQELELSLPAGRLKGNMAIVSNPGSGQAQFAFSQLSAYGDAWQATDTRIGPILGTQYTLSRQSLNLTAQLMPIPEGQLRHIALERLEGETWLALDTTELMSPGYTASFHIPNWPDSLDHQYRVSLSYQDIDNKWRLSRYEGRIRRDPGEIEDELVVAGFTGNHNVSKPGIPRNPNVEYGFDASHIWYPHRDLVEKVAQHNPDLLFFSGDQVYEAASPSFPDRKQLELDYLYKWYLWHLAYRPLTRDMPTICLPDDHDVYQGNLWGAGGPATDKDDKGGYVHPAWFVKMVERTQTSHLPQPFDPRPIEQGIGVYYTDMVYGGVGIAILEDRKFKSGCAGLPFQTRGRPDHINDPDFDIKRADVPGTSLLGKRQLDFLDHFVSDWTGQYMKLALSQTIFANMATHHGSDLFRLRADLDSNGWPQSGRNRALATLRKGFVFHLAGDQHLASLVHHGIDEWDDAIWSFCVPSIANFYPRAWMPEAEGQNNAPDMPGHLGKHRDGLGNLVNVQAVTNPTSITAQSTGVAPLILHDNMPGYGILKINKSAAVYEVECWPRYADPGQPSQMYPGWPRRISRGDNYAVMGKAVLDLNLPDKGAYHQVQVFRANSTELLYSLASRDSLLTVDQKGRYDLIIKDMEGNPLAKQYGVLAR